MTEYSPVWVPNSGTVPITPPINMAGANAFSASFLIGSLAPNGTISAYAKVSVDGSNYYWMDNSGATSPGPPAAALGTSLAGTFGGFSVSLPNTTQAVRIAFAWLQLVAVASAAGQAMLTPSVNIANI